MGGSYPSVPMTKHSDGRSLTLCCMSCLPLFGHRGNGPSGDDMVLNTAILARIKGRM